MILIKLINNKYFIVKQYRMKDNKSVIEESKLRRGLKYLVHWIILFIAIKYIPSTKLSIEDVTKIAIFGAVSFAILDLYAPIISKNGKRQIGMSLGMKTLLA
jgi:hypothetical protein